MQRRRPAGSDIHGAERDLYLDAASRGERYLAAILSTVNALRIKRGISRGDDGNMANLARRL